MMESVDRELVGKLSVRLNDDDSLNWDSSCGSVGPLRPELPPSKLFILLGMLKPGMFGRFMLLLFVLNVFAALLLGG